jgi:hypothetical protein
LLVAWGWHRLVIITTVIVAVLAGCSLGAAAPLVTPGTPLPTASPSDTPGPSATATPPGTSGATATLPGTIVLEAWGEIWVAMPSWFTLPADAQIVADATQTVAFTTGQNTQTILASITRAFEAHGFTVDYLANGEGGDAVSFAGPTDACNPVAVASPSGDGSLVEIRYEAACPW